VVKSGIRVARSVLALLVLVAGIASFGAMVLAQEFPFGMELTLDAAPMSGSKRVPRIEIGDDGGVQIDLWCKSATGRFSVANNSVIFIPGQIQDNGCPADRAAADDNLLAALSAVTGWKRQGDWLTLTGPRVLRFLLLTN
jgi:META domain